MEFKKGDIVEVIKEPSNYSYKKGNLAVVTDPVHSYYKMGGALYKFLEVKWLPGQLNRRGEPLGQMNGGYDVTSFKLHSKKFKFLI